MSNPRSEVVSETSLNSMAIQDKPLQWGRLGRSILNGVMGDYLEKQCNPLAIKMALYHEFKPLSLDDQLAHQLDFPLTNKIVVLVHGLTNLETVWDFDRKQPESVEKGLENETNVDHYIDSLFGAEGGRARENYGTKLQEDFGFTPFFLRYNTGLSLEKNARDFSLLLTKLCRVYPLEIEQFVLVGFSMGGLLTRYAQMLALESKKNPIWREKLTECFYIGTPHEGAPLEKFGYLTSELLRYIPKDYVSHWAEWIDVRSQGIKDLKHGLKKLNEGQEQAVCQSFAPHARHYFISGALAAKAGLVNTLFGDSLVRQQSAHPSSAPLQGQNAHFEGMSHVQLANSRRVYQQIKTWLEESAKSPSASRRKLQKFYPALLKPYMPKNQDDLSAKEILAGSMDLLATAYEKTVETVETLHYSIADEPFNVLQKIPVIAQITTPVEMTHRQILDSVYKTLRDSGKWLHASAKSLK